MKQVGIKIAALLMSATAVTAAANCITDTTQAQFQAGVANKVDLTSSPGDVVLSSSGSTGGIDQQNTTYTANGEVFTNVQWTGQTFTAGASGSLTRVDLNLFCVFCSTAPPSIIVSIRATSGGLPTGGDLATSSLTISQYTGAQVFYSANFATPTTVSARTQYAIIIRASAAYGSGRNLGFTDSAISASQGNDVYGGGALIFSTNSGSTWQVQTYGTTPTSDGAFKTYVGGVSYTASGDLISSLKDSAPPSGTTPTWDSLAWSGSAPTNTTLRFQAAASNSTSGPFTFVGPDGTSGSFFSNGASLAQFNGNRYVKYRAFLATTNGSATPTLSDVTACYSSQSSSADLSITVSDGATTEIPGTPVTYSITAANAAGSATATGATVTDTFPAGLTNCAWTCSASSGASCPASGSGNINAQVTLAAGTSATFSATCSIGSALTGSLANTASIAAPAGVSDTNSANNNSTDTDTLTPQANLTITNSDGVSSATPGGQVTYAITAANTGPSNANGATVADTFPSTLTCSWTCSGANSGTCPASGSGNVNSSVNLPSGASVTYTAACTISASATGTLTNTATVTAPNGVTDTNSGNNSASDSDSLSASTNVAATMTDNVELVRVGDVVTYVIEVTNTNGTSTASVTVSDNLPAQLTNGSWVCSGTNGGTCGSASGSGNVLSDNKASVAAGGKIDYLYTATVVSANSNGQVSNTASVKVTSGGNQATVNMSINDADTVVVFANGFDGAGAATAAATAVGGGGASMTIDLGVDAGLLNHVDTAPVTVATGRSANGGKLFSVQLVRLGSDVAMRTLTTIDDTAFSDVSPWQVVNLKSHVISLDWRTASAHGDDGLLRVGSAASPSSLSAHNERENLTRLDVTVDNNVPWLVPMAQ